MDLFITEHCFNNRVLNSVAPHSDQILLLCSSSCSCFEPIFSLTGSSPIIHPPSRALGLMPVLTSSSWLGTSIRSTLPSTHGLGLVLCLPCYTTTLVHTSVFSASGLKGGAGCPPKKSVESFQEVAFTFMMSGSTVASALLSDLLVTSW